MNSAWVTERLALTALDYPIRCAQTDWTSCSAR